jgi:hypothetical protein
LIPFGGSIYSCISRRWSETKKVLELNLQSANLLDIKVNQKMPSSSEGRAGFGHFWALKTHTNCQI